MYIIKDHLYINSMAKNILRYKKKLLQRWNRGKYVVLRVGSLGKIKKKDYTTIMANINVNIHKTRNPARRTQCYLNFTFVNCI